MRVASAPQVNEAASRVRQAPLSWRRHLRVRANAHPRRQSEHHALDDAQDRRGGEGRGLARRRGQRRQSRLRAAQHRGLFRRGVLASGLDRGDRQGGKRRRLRHRLFRRHRARGGATGAPVVGIGEAAFHMASLIADKFSVVTTLSRSIAPIERNLAKYGLEARCARVRAADAPVLALEDPNSGARRLIEKEIERALDEDGAEAIVLGCAGMTDLARDLERQAGVPVLDGVACAVSLAESLVRLGLRTSKRNTYAAPLAKPYTGEFKRFAPR